MKKAFPVLMAIVVAAIVFYYAIQAVFSYF